MSARLWAIVVTLGLLLVACSGSSTRAADPPATEPTTTSTTAVPAATTTAPTTTTTTQPPRPPLGLSVAFMDSCVAGEGLAGPCRCALGAISGVVADGDWDVLEDRLLADQDFQPAIVDAVSACRDASAPSIDLAVIDALSQTCVEGGSGEVACRCAAVRASQIVPAELIDEFAVSQDVVPSLADLAARCSV